ncbi:hypothetical protein CRUP_032371, partial [Coryphaenoides rupestris]
LTHSSSSRNFDSLQQVGTLTQTVLCEENTTAGGGEGSYRLTEIGSHRQLLTSELWNLQGKEKKSETDQEESEFDSSKQPDSPAVEEEVTTPKGPTPGHGPNPKYQLLLNHEGQGNGLSSRSPERGGGGSVGENSPRGVPWETSRLGPSHYRGSLESLASRDWDTTSDRHGGFDSPPRVFHSPYSTPTSMEYNPSFRMSDFKGGLSPATSEMNLYSYNSRSTSPVHSNTLGNVASSRTRFSTFDTLRRRPEMSNNIGFSPTTQVLPNLPMRSATLGAPNRRDYIEELTKQMDTIQKRNQFLEAESVEMEKERNQIRFEMRGLLVNNEDLLRANTQLTNDGKRMREHMIELEREHQGMGERYRQMEENLEKQTQHAQTMAEKLWLAERQLEELEVDKDTRDKRTSDLSSTIFRLEEELGDAMLLSSQAGAELNLQQKLREDAQLRVEELEESHLEKDQELQRTLEEEIQLRERLQLQCKQAERTVDDLQMELQTANQAREDLAKQLKTAQENMIDLETDLEETELLQQKVIQEQHLNEQLDSEKGSLERQLRDLRLEVEELHSSRVQDDVISRSEGRVKDLENSLRTEESWSGRSMTQRIRALKRQLNEAEEETGRKEVQYRHAQRELAEERESAGRLQRQLLDQHLQTKRKETMMMRQTLDNLRLDLSVDDDEPVEGEQLAIV